LQNIWSALRIPAGIALIIGFAGQLSGLGAVAIGTRSYFPTTVDFDFRDRMLLIGKRGSWSDGGDTLAVNARHRVWSRTLEWALEKEGEMEVITICWSNEACDLKHNLE